MFSGFAVCFKGKTPETKHAPSKESRGPRKRLRVCSERQSALVLKDFKLPPYGEVMTTDRESMTPLKDIISNLLRDGGLPFNPDDANIWKVWDEVVGAAIAKNAQPSWIKSGRLKVIVSDPIWLQELEFLEESIREKLNERLARKAVEKIEFRVGPR
jgi:hypothetical protein